MSRRSIVTEWLQGMDDPETDGPPPSDEMRPLMTQTDSSSGQPSIAVDQAETSLKEDVSGQGLESEPVDTLKIGPGEDDLQLPPFDQLQQEMDWMEDFNRNTLESQKAPPQPERSADSDPLQYLQEPAEEENQIEDSEEDPEERPQNANPAAELNRENQAEPGGEPAGAEVEDEDAEGNDEADDDEEDDDGNEDDNEEDDEDGEASDEDVGTVSPTSTITTV